MPGYISHCVGGQETLRLLPKDISEVILRRRAAYFWGTQGPDPFFFYQVYLPHSPYPKLGGLMHAEKTAQMMTFMEKYINRQQNQWVKELLLSYYFGFVTHYCMDKTLHPYVYYHQENMSGRVEARFHQGIHHNIENRLDALIWREYEGKRLRDFSVPSYFKIERRELSVIARLYTVMLWEVFGQTTSDDAVEDAFRECGFLFALLMDRNHLLYPLARLVDRLRKKSNDLASHVKRRYKKTELMNHHNLPWQPVGSELEDFSTESVPQLITKAAEEASEWIQRSYFLLKSGSCREYLELVNFEHQ